MLENVSLAIASPSAIGNPMIRKKVCLLGAYAVGKTSLAARFVHSMFDEKYLTTVGVKIDKKSIQIEDRDLDLIIWDLAGEDEFVRVRTSYFRGAAGYLLVVDGTRPATLEVADALRERIRSAVGPLPHVVLANKSDLVDDWHVADTDLQSLVEDGSKLFRTSAKTGVGVEEAFDALAREMIRSEA